MKIEHPKKGQTYECNKCFSPMKQSFGWAIWHCFSCWWSYDTWYADFQLKIIEGDDGYEKERERIENLCKSKE